MRGSQETVTIRPRLIKLDTVTRETLELEFQQRFFEAALAQEPNNLDCLVQLGDVYSRRGLHEKGLQIDSRLTQLCPDEPTFHYNLACSYSVLGRCDESMCALANAIELGYDDFDQMKRDEDLANLRSSPRFEELLNRRRDAKNS